MTDNLKTNLTRGATWRRGLFMLLFGILYGIAEFVLTAVVLLQFGSHLLTGAANARLLDFARTLNAYIYQILQFVTYRSELRPFPLSAWPTGRPEPAAAAEASTSATPADAATQSRAAEEPREY